MRRRIYSLEFPRRFYGPTEIEGMSDGQNKEYAKHDQANTHLINEIEVELPGVVNVLVRAYQRLIKHGGFSVPKDVKRSNDKLLRESNPLPMFIETQCTHGAKFRFRTSAFVEDLATWLEAENNDWTPQNHQVRTMMNHLGWDVVKNDGIDHYVGIKLKDRTPNTYMRIDDDLNSDDDDLDDWDDFPDVEDNVIEIH